MTKSKYVVLGAGPTGLMAAWRLIKEGHEVILLERDARVGGFGASFKRDGFILDYGPHALHMKEGEVIPIAKLLLGKYLQTNKNNVRTLANGKYLRYPFQFYNLVTQISPFLALRMIIDFLSASIIYNFIHVPDDTFEAWGVNRFGKTLYNFCFGHYTQKVWGMPSRMISPKFAAKKIQGLNFKKIISKIFGGKGEEHEIYWEQVLYPEHGSGELFEKMAEDFLAKGGKLYLNSVVTQINYENQKVTSVKYSKDNKEHSIDADHVISSLPLRNLVLMLKPSFGDYISYMAKRLRFRGMLFVYVVLNTDQVSEAHWIYLLDPIFKFNRVTEQKNLSKACAPDGKTVLCFEMCCSSSDEIWNYSPEKLRELVLEEIKNIKIIDSSLIVDCFVEKKDDAYAVCHLRYEEQVKDLLEHLSTIKQLITTGRQGLYCHIDMHDSMALGLSAAEFCLNGRQDPLKWYKEKTAYLDWDR